MNGRQTARQLVFLFPAMAGAILYFFLPPVVQPESYHHFADQRTILGVPHFFDVVSNLPFAVVGILGLRAADDAVSRVLFTGILLVAAGSGYYHLHPDTPRLAWDRAPMTVAFMALVVLLLEEFWSPRAARLMFLPLVALGLFSIWWWRRSGDLRLYGLVQFVPMLVILGAVLVSRSRANRALWIAFLFYALAKVAENFDAAVFRVLPVSGHTVKHVLAGLAAYCIYRWRVDRLEAGKSSSFAALQEL